MSPASNILRRRFWVAAHLVEEADGLVVRLDGRPLRLPAGMAGGMVLGPMPRALAEAVAGEWSLAGDGVGGSFGPDDLPVTALAATMQQHVAPAPDVAAGRLIGFAGSDLLCYRATHPDELVTLQEKAWQPWLDWLEETQGIGMRVSQGLMPISQPEPVMAGLRQLVGGLPIPILTGLGVLVPGLGSLVLGLAVAAGRLEGGEAFRLARLDETFQSSHWGIDREAEAQGARLGRDIALAARFMTLTR